jgi:Flp pilus assembly pilin Flp
MLRPILNVIQRYKSGIGARVVAWARDERGQDLAEYCLITALISLIALGIIWHISGGLEGTWGAANAALISGNSGSAQSSTTTQ